LQEKPELNGTEILFTATQRMHRITPGSEGRIETGVGFGEIFSSHFWLGIEHIITGYDHLAFVFCLLLIGGTRRQSLWLITGFTLGHSVTLALAALGLVRADPQVVEALIGFSIALVAAERILARYQLMPLTGLAVAAGFFFLSFVFSITQGGFGLSVWAGLILFCLAYGLAIRSEADTIKFAPIMTLAFGLIHGFGFAGLLSDIGLPPDNLISALFGFNIGIEIGQLLVFVPLVVFGPYLLEELPTPPVKWADIAALVLTVFGVYLFVSRALI
jgi:Na+-transporting NADH:ubiquinone oxidoreductase subunit NqrD